MTVWFDIEDLFHYFEGGHKRISGIQRLTFEIYRAATTLGGVRFVRHAEEGLGLDVVEWAEVEAAFASVAGSEPDEASAPAPQHRSQQAPLPASPVARSGLRRLARRLTTVLPERVRAPLVLGTVLQAQAVGEFGRFGAGLVRHAAAKAARGLQTTQGGRPRAAAAPAGSFEDLARPGDALLVLGSPWFRAEYSRLARYVRDERRMRFGVLIHDLVPVLHPEWSHSGVARTFKDWYGDVLPFCDLVLANSRHTASDVEAYAREGGITLPGSVIAVPVGTGFGPPAAVDSARPEGLPPAGSYVLFVSTLEARKNHALAVAVWRRLLAEVRAGTRAAASVPDLVFAGRVGWLVADLVQELENTDWLGGRVKLIQEPSDMALQALYQGCLFTFFPSLHEGWGLPVTESLSLGKPCLVSNAAALPEAGGVLCRYFDPEDVPGACREVTALLDDRPGLAAWEMQVRAEFRPVAWTTTAEAVLGAVAALDG